MWNAWSSQDPTAPVPHTQGLPGGWGKRSDPPPESGGPHAFRTTHSLDTGGGLLHDHLRRDPAGPSRRIVIRGNRRSSAAISQLQAALSANAAGRRFLLSTERRAKTP